MRLHLSVTHAVELQPVTMHMSLNAGTRTYSKHPWKFTTFRLGGQAACIKAIYLQDSCNCDSALLLFTIARSRSTCLSNRRPSSSMALSSAAFSCCSSSTTASDWSASCCVCATWACLLDSSSLNTSCRHLAICFSTGGSTCKQHNDSHNGNNW